MLFKLKHMYIMRFKMEGFLHIFLKTTKDLTPICHKVLLTQINPWNALDQHKIKMFECNVKSKHIHHYWCKFGIAYMNIQCKVNNH
jgi:hypothetical protein